MMGSKRRPRRADHPQVLASRAALQAQVDEHKEAYGCPGNATLYPQSCPCGRKTLVMCSACDIAVVMVMSKDPCHHEIVYHMDDGTTVRPFEGF